MLPLFKWPTCFECLPSAGIRRTLMCRAGMNADRRVQFCVKKKLFFRQSKFNNVKRTPRQRKLYRVFLRLRFESRDTKISNIDAHEE